MLKLLLIEDMKTERIAENEVLGKANDLESHNPRAQQDQKFPKDCLCTKGGIDAQVVCDLALGVGKA